MKVTDESQKEFVSILLGSTFELSQLASYLPLEFGRIYWTTWAAHAHLIKEFHDCLVDWIALPMSTTQQRLPKCGQVCYKLRE